MAVQLDKRLFTVQEYHKMLDAGILDEDDRVELIDGEIVEMAPIHMPHALRVARLNELFFRRLGGQALIWPQNPIRLSADTEVQPDVALLKPRDYSQDQDNPGPEDVLLIVEVSDSTLASDRRVKVPLYARAGVSDVWLIGVHRGIVEVYSELRGGAYQQVRRVSKGEVVQVPGFPGVIVLVDEVLG